MGGVEDQIISLSKTLENQSVSKFVERKKQSEENIIKSIRNIFKLKIENVAIKERIIGDVRTLLKQENAYYKPIRVGNFRNKNYIKY